MTNLTPLTPTGTGLAANKKVPGPIIPDARTGIIVATSIVS
jgi:hypothetical protein